MLHGIESAGIRDGAVDLSWLWVRRGAPCVADYVLLLPADTATTWLRRQAAAAAIFLIAFKCVDDAAVSSVDRHHDAKVLNSGRVWAAASFAETKHAIACEFDIKMPAELSKVL